MQNQRIRIRLKAFDHRLIDQSTQEIVDTALGNWNENSCPAQVGSALKDGNTKKVKVFIWLVDRPAGIPSVDPPAGRPL